MHCSRLLHHADTVRGSLAYEYPLNRRVELSIIHDDVTKMETFSTLLVNCAGNSPVPAELPTQRPVTRRFDVYFDLRPNKRLCKQSWGWWFETPSCPLWRHRNGMRLFRINFPEYSYYLFGVCSKMMTTTMMMMMVVLVQVLVLVLVEVVVVMMIRTIMNDIRCFAFQQQRVIFNNSGTIYFLLMFIKVVALKAWLYVADHHFLWTQPTRTDVFRFSRNNYHQSFDA